MPLIISSIRLRTLTSFLLVFLFLVMPVAPVLAQTEDSPVDAPLDIPLAEASEPAVLGVSENVPGGAINPPEGADRESTVPALSSASQGAIFTPDDITPQKTSLAIKPDQATGALTYEYPIYSPSGRLGMTPNLALKYNSQNQDNSSILGYGWSLNIPYIQRQNVNGTNQLYSSFDFTSSLSGDLTPTSSTTNSTIIFGAKVGRQINIAEDLLVDYAPILAKTKTEAETAKIVDRIAGLQRTTKKPPVQAVGIGADTGIPSKSRVAINLPETRSQELFTNWKASKPESVSTILNLSPSQFTNFRNSSFIQDYYKAVSKISQETLPAFKANIKEATGIMPDIRVKKFDSFIGKIERYLNKKNPKNPAKIADNLAGRIITDETNINNVLRNVQRNFKLIEQPDNFFQTPTEWGYRGINIKTKLPNGLPAEIQIHTPVSEKIANAIQSSALCHSY